jgi:hypothetical protein
LLVFALLLLLPELPHAATPIASSPVAANATNLRGLNLIDAFLLWVALVRGAAATFIATPRAG